MGFGADLDGKQGMYMRKHVIEMAQKGLVENLKTLKPLMTPTTRQGGLPAASWHPLHIIDIYCPASHPPQFTADGCMCM